MKKTSVSSQSLETFRYPKHKYPKNEYPSKPQKVIFTKVRQLFVGNVRRQSLTPFAMAFFFFFFYLVPICTSLSDTFYFITCFKLPFRVRWQDLKDLFRKVGNIERADVVLNSENKSKGHGTVLFATIEDAQRAIGKISINI
jgi:RNA recognition motif-containing protein